jgi:hypothetical protein
MGDGVRQQRFIEKLALSILARDGNAAIWKLNEAAAAAHLKGHPRSATTVLEIADAVEAAWRSPTERLLQRLIALGAQVDAAGYPLA